MYFQQILRMTDDLYAIMKRKSCARRSTPYIQNTAKLSEVAMISRDIPPPGQEETFSEQRTSTAQVSTPLTVCVQKIDDVQATLEERPK